MDLSFDPRSWSLSNVAEFACEKLTGSEFAGDVVGAMVGFATGDVLSGYDQLADGADNVGKFLGDSRVQDAAGDYFGTGAVKSPEGCKCGTGYEDESPTTQTPTKPPASSGGSDAFAGLNLDGLSTEELIFTLLMAAIKEKREGVKEKGDQLKNLSARQRELQAGGGDGSEAGKVGDEKDDILRKLQNDTNSLQQMSQLLTGMMSSFHQMNQSIIQNIR